MIAGLFFFGLVVTACATYQSKVEPARDDLRWGRKEAAIETFAKLASEESSDRLVYLLDHAMALQAAGRYEDSNRVLIEADRLADQLDYHSVSKVAGSFLLNEEVKQYKGDTFEKIFINAQLALNFLALGNLESALVEARRINEKYTRLRREDKKEFELNPFAKYLSALIWEADRKFDDAAIALTEVHALAPGTAGLPEDLLRVTRRARRMDEHSRWKAMYPQAMEDPRWAEGKWGTLVVIVQQGWGPRKAPSRADARFPELRRVFSHSQRARVEISLGGASFHSETQRVYDVTEAAIKTLEDDRAALLARRVGGLVAKEVAADQIRQKDELLGFFAWIFLHASDRADLRQWSTLPESIQISRVSLPAGSAKVRLAGVDEGGAPTSEEHEVEVNMGAGQTKFVIWRMLK